MLTPSAVKNAKPKAKPYKLADERGMYLLVRPNGGKLWRFDYRRPGTKKRNTLSLGVYPDVSLKKARERRDEARKKLADGIDAGEQRKAEATAGADTFEAIGREWYEKNAPRFSDSYKENLTRRLEKDIYPWIGRKPIGTITAPDVLAVMRRVDERGARDLAHRVGQACGQVFMYAIATGRAMNNPLPSTRGAIPPSIKKHFAAIIEPDMVGELLRAIDGYKGTFVVRAALKLSPLVFTRPGELRRAEWVEFNLEAAEWRIPAEKMKAGEMHIIPLARQAVAILQELRPLTGAGRYVFPGARKRTNPMSEATVNNAIHRMGFVSGVMTAHGFRGMASTILNEQGWRADVIERQLAHGERNKIRAAYNHAQHLAERRKMMQAWADYLDTLREGGRKVVPIQRKAG